MSRLLSCLMFVACGHDPGARTPSASHADASSALAALRGAQFEEAEFDANAVLAKDPRNSQAAAVRAIAAYQQAGSTLVSTLGEVMDQAEGFKFFDHERGRAAWKTFADRLSSIDKDLEIVAADPQFALELCVACWEHDWNRNGRIDDHDRKLFEIEYDGKGGELPDGDPRRRPTFRFDVGDALWARAMVSFQRALVELVLAYRWSELDQIFNHGGDKLAIHLVDPGRVKRARELVLAGLTFADQTRAAYLAETDDDREWVPNPRQKSHPVPLEVDDALYATWGAVTGDLRKLLASEEGISLRQLGGALDKDLERKLPDAYLDLGAMLREPTDFVILTDKGEESPEMFERVLRGFLGHGYATHMRASPLVARLRHMKDDLDHGDDTFERKLRYLMWFN